MMVHAGGFVASANVHITALCSYTNYVCSYVWRVLCVLYVPCVLRILCVPLHVILVFGDKLKDHCGHTYADLTKNKQHSRHAELAKHKEHSRLRELTKYRDHSKHTELTKH